ncbi:MAG: hypothetical protein ABL890_02980 [Candidatus Peribacteraceae bacterium]
MSDGIGPTGGSNSPDWGRYKVKKISPAKQVGDKNPDESREEAWRLAEEVAQKLQAPNEGSDTEKKLPRDAVLDALVQSQSIQSVLGDIRKSVEEALQNLKNMRCIEEVEEGEVRE